MLISCIDIGAPVRGTAFDLSYPYAGDERTLAGNPDGATMDESRCYKTGASGNSRCTS